MMALYGSPLILLLLTIFIVCVTSSTICPRKQCTTDENAYGQLVYSCSNAGCTQIPVNDTLDIGVDVIDLSYNNITKVPRLLPYKKLSSLNLTHNKIETIVDDAFESCEKLRVLNLGVNNIAQLSEDLFRGLGSLERLFLNDNQIEFLNNSLIFFYMMDLKVLELQNNGMRYIHENAMSGMSVLDTLRLSNNSLRSLGLDTFLGMWDLRYLYLDNNQLEYLHNETFTTQRSLDVLDLRNNRLRRLDHEIFDPLKQLKVVHLSSNPLTTIQQGLFQDPPLLEDIYLDHTDIEEVQPGAFPSTLMKISLSSSENLLKIVNGTFTNLKQLKTVTVQDNPRLHEIEPGAFSGPNTSVETVVLANNALTTLSEELLAWKDVESLDLRGNRWDCTCHLAWMLSTLSKDQLREIKCYTPLMMRGTALDGLEPSHLSCNFVYQHRFEGGIALVLIALLSLIAVVAFVVYRYRQRIFRRCARKVPDYKTLYEVDDATDDEDAVTFAKTSISNAVVGARLAADANGSVPRSSAV